MLTHILLSSIEIIYKNILKKIFFCFDPEKVHISMVNVGQSLGTIPLFTHLSTSLLSAPSPLLTQNIAGVHFNNPIGLSAGFDYEGKLTQILPAIGFGFGTVGTITNYAYEGNPAPRLGRLPKSLSLMVNKGFKNNGAKATVSILEKVDIKFPVGISIGRSNNGTCTTLQKSIDDILQAFKLFEKSSVHHSYYELNISCPNLFGNVSFYPSKNLRLLLKAIDSLKLSKPLFIKMPIDKSDKEVLEMLAIIAGFSPKGVIFGNLQKDRKNKVLHPTEVAKFAVGNFSGKPTFERSNELIRLAYKNYKKRFVIIGSGGVFSAEDAYKKIKLGASLVQLITGMIFNGPQLIAQINYDLVKLLKKDGYTNISQAIGQEV